MKNLKIYVVFTICLIVLTNCNCEHCIDNISAENKKIPYADSTTVYFKNDTLGIIIDTVFVKLGEVSTKPYACISRKDDHNNLCSALSYIKYSNFFEIEIYQSNNFYQNETVFQHYTPKNQHSTTDTINYTYKNQNITALHTYYKQEHVDSIIWNLYNENDTIIYNNYVSIIEPEIKLLEYSTIYKDGTRRMWRLKE
ncbi:MAG: hypothetical protein PF481_11335 [Bacteroidales bacterium]|jgi:hypothetical protein|nr:hypothetical protein [Bacteroidales bacterium]